MHAVYPKFSKLSNISSADIIWSHFEKTNSMQTVIARLPKSKILDLAFFSNGMLGGKLKLKKYFTNTSFYQSQLFKRSFIGWCLNFNPLSRIAPY